MLNALCSSAVIFLSFFFFNNTVNANTTELESTWDLHYSDSHFTNHEKSITYREHHSEQNMEITKDFLKQIFFTAPAVQKFCWVLSDAHNIVEIGCGTGELSNEVGKIFKSARIVGTDISANAVQYAIRQNKNPNVSFCQFDCLKEDLKEKLGKFDIGICSNVLEHFKNPFHLLDGMLSACDVGIVLVPYKQPVTDGYDMEGGVGHVFTFDENSFVNYRVLSWFTFKSGGWQYSSRGEVPLQMAVLLTK